MKKQVKVYKGYVPKKETLKETMEQAYLLSGFGGIDKVFGMLETKKVAMQYGNCVKRTITITSEDEEVK